MIAMADPEKHRDGMNVVRRPERKCPFFIEPVPQLNFAISQ